MNKRGGGEKKKPAVFSTSSVGRSLCDIVRPFWIPMETKKKKSTCLLEMLSLTPCSRAKIVRKKKTPDEGRGDAE